MAIGGVKREQTEGNFSKQIGMFEGKVIAINPTIKEYKSILDIELKDDSKACNYVGERDGVTTVRLDFWIEQIKNEDPFRHKISFFLKDEERENKDKTKFQYINSVGMSSWASDPESLMEWFTKDREVRVAYVGESELYDFLRVWMGALDYRDTSTELELSWKKLIKGNISEIEAQIDGEWVLPFVSMATVSVKQTETALTEYQGIYNKMILPSYSLAAFNLVDYSNPIVQQNIQARPLKELKSHEKFVANVIGQYGCKDIYSFESLKEYDANAHLVATDEAIDDSASADY